MMFNAELAVKGDTIPARALVDAGATHCYVSETFIRKITLPIRQQHTWLSLANGSKAVSLGKAVLPVDIALHCPRAAHLLRLSAALTITGLDLLAGVGDTVSCLFLAGVCNAFYSSGLLLTTCLLLLVDFLGTNMLQELTGYAHTVVASLLPMSCT